MKYRTQKILNSAEFQISFKNCNRIEFKFKLARSKNRKRDEFKSYINQFLLTNSNNFILYYTYIYEVLYLNHKVFWSFVSERLETR